MAEASSINNRTTREKRGKINNSDGELSPGSITSKASSHTSTSLSGQGVVKWLYPGADQCNSSSNNAEMASDQSVVGSELNNRPDPEDDASEQLTSMQARTSTDDDETTGGPDTDAVSMDDLPIDGDGGKTAKVADELSQKMSASANYLGSIFSNAWSKTAKTANDATANSSSFLSSAFTKVAGSGVGNVPPKAAQSGGEPAETHANSSKSDSSAPTDKDGTSSDNKATVSSPAPAEDEGSATNAMSSFFTSALSNTFGFAQAQSSEASGGESKEDALGDEKNATNAHPAAYNFSMEGLNSAFNFVGKAAVDATSALKDKVGAPSIISEFNKEQENFIKSKGNAHTDTGVAPWVGYENEDELKAKILSLSEDKRTFIRAPPSGVSFEFEYDSVLPTALALIKEDERLEKMRYELVPKRVKENEFWRNYFYRVSLIKQSFELKDMAASSASQTTERKSTTAASSRVSAQELEESQGLGDDDEFVSESYQASTSDMQEAAESMKKLGVGGDTDELEAELEGELNEFEVVSKKNGVEEDNAEWESQIQEMLEAEESEQNQ